MTNTFSFVQLWTIGDNVVRRLSTIPLKTIRIIRSLQICATTKSHRANTAGINLYRSMTTTECPVERPLYLQQHGVRLTCWASKRRGYIPPTVYVEIDEHNLEWRDRRIGRGGVVTVNIHDSVPCSRRKDLEK